MPTIVPIAKANTHTSSRPLCVALDGALVRSDLLLESVFALLKRNALFVFLIPIWLLKGKACLKRQIADRVELDVSLLPYQETFLVYLRHEHANGRRLILVSACNERFARSVARHLGIFEDVLASNETIHLYGGNRLERLQWLFADSGFDYAGNTMVDLPLWKQARNVLLINPEPGVKESVAELGRVAQVFDDRDGYPLKRYVSALRLHHWLKNLMVFIPLLMAHRLDEPVLLGQAVLAFISFGLCASSVYLLNDLLDLPDDRRHPTKCYRPFAAGSISMRHGIMLIPALLISAFLVALLLPIGFIAVLGLYYGTTLAYSLKLKQIPLVDVLTLAGLYTARIVAGAAAVSVKASFWLLAFSLFLFLSLAMVKRVTELLALDEQGATSVSGRAYTSMDLETLSHFGGASAYMAVLVLAFYINSDAVRQLYTHPELIWLLCPLLLYMVTRIWMMARRGELHEDPVVFVIEDRRSQWLAGASAVLLWLAA